MKFYYELVDDLLQREEFAKLVESRINDTGGILEDHVAAMLVLKDLGRAHQKIDRLDGGASLVLFFGKVIEKSGPRVFKKEGGDSGYVSDILVGDETGNARLLLWGDKARGIEEIDPGDVIEVFARLKSKDEGIPQLSVIALKESSSEIRCLNPAISGTNASPASLHSVTLRIVAVWPKSFLRKDGSDGKYTAALGGNESGVFRIVCWAPELFEDIQPGNNVVIENVLIKSNRGMEEFHLNENSGVSPIDREVEVSFTDTSGISEGGYYSVKGRVYVVNPPRHFTRQNGEESWVRMITIVDECGELPVVMWGDLALLHIVRDDYVAIYNTRAKEGRSGGIELNTSGGSAIEFLNDGSPSSINIRGTVVRSPFGYTIDDGLRCYFLNAPLKNGSEVFIEGQILRKIITPEKCSLCPLSKQSVLNRVDNFINRLSVK